MAPCRSADEGVTPRAAYTAAAFAAVRGRGACVEGRGGAHVEVGCRRTKPGVRASIQREGEGRDGLGRIHGGVGGCRM